MLWIVFGEPLFDSPSNPTHTTLPNKGAHLPHHNKPPLMGDVAIETKPHAGMTCHQYIDPQESSPTHYKPANVASTTS